MKQVAVNRETVKCIGRVYCDENGMAWLGMSGCAVEFRFRGKQLTICLVADERIAKEWKPNNYARVAIEINGKRVVETMLDTPSKQFEIANGTEEKDMCVRIIKLSEMAMSTVGVDKFVVDDNAAIDRVGLKKYSIEFIGDSITCGYAVDDEDLSHTFTTETEDTTRAYAYRTAQLLDADYSMFSASGHGIISGYTADPDCIYTKELIPPLYLSYGRSEDSFGKAGKPEEINWDFESISHDAVVLNLGTNDDSYCQDNQDKQRHFMEAYVEFLKVIRSRNKKAVIFCVLGIMGDRLYPVIEKACEKYSRETGDYQIHAFRLPGQDGSEGYVVDYHPVAAVHQRAAVAMAEFMKERMCWQN